MNTKEYNLMLSEYWYRRHKSVSTWKPTTKRQIKKKYKELNLALKYAETHREIADNH